MEYIYASGLTSNMLFFYEYFHPDTLEAITVSQTASEPLVIPCAVG